MEIKKIGYSLPLGEGLRLNNKEEKKVTKQEPRYTMNTYQQRKNLETDVFMPSKKEDKETKNEATDTR